MLLPQRVSRYSRIGFYCHPFVFMTQTIALTSCQCAFLLGLINVLSACQADIFVAPIIAEHSSTQYININFYIKFSQTKMGGKIMLESHCIIITSTHRAYLLPSRQVGLERLDLCIWSCLPFVPLMLLQHLQSLTPTLLSNPASAQGCLNRKTVSQGKPCLLGCRKGQPHDTPPVANTHTHTHTEACKRECSGLLSISRFAAHDPI